MLFFGICDICYTLVKAVDAVLAGQNIQLVLLYCAFCDFLVVGLVVDMDGRKLLS